MFNKKDENETRGKRSACQRFIAKKGKLKKINNNYSERLARGREYLRAKRREHQWKPRITMVPGFCCFLVIKVG